MTLSPGRVVATIAVGLQLFSCAITGYALAATVKPLEILAERLPQQEIEKLAADHRLRSSLLGKSIDLLNQRVTVSSSESAVQTLKQLDIVAGNLSAARRSSAALSGYLAANRSRLQDAGLGRLLPLAALDGTIEKPYYDALDTFLNAAIVFARYCRDNFAAISSGGTAEWQRYEELYAGYLRQVDLFNEQSSSRSQRLAAMASDHPAFAELLPN